MPAKSNFKIFVLFFCVMCMTGGCAISLRQPAEEIRRKLFEEFPIKSSFEQIAFELKSKGLHPKIRKTTGFLKQELFSPVEVVGSKSIRVHLGSYSNCTFPFFTEQVTAFFGFNDEEELIDIWIWKDTDSL